MECSSKFEKRNLVRMDGLVKLREQTISDNSFLL